MSDSSSAYLTLSQVAARTGRHPELLRQWCAAGRIPCERLGGSWVVLETDLELLDGMATRARRRAAVVPAPTGRRRLIAAVFDDAERAATAGQTLRDRLKLDPDAVETAPIGIDSLSAFGLTVVAGVVAAERTLDARRILAAYAGRIVADIDSESSSSVPPRHRSERRRAVGAP